MANIEKIDTDIALALKFFGIEPNEMDKAKDIKWLEKQNIIHQLNNEKRQMSNQYFAILKQNQHRLDFVGRQLNQIELIDRKQPKADDNNWFNKEYKKPEVQPEVASSQDILAFKRSIEQAFMTVSIKDGEINSREGNFNKFPNENTTHFTPPPAYNNGKRADGVCIAGAWISVIGAIIALLMSIDWWYISTWTYYGGWTETFNFWGVVSSALCVWTISENSKVINGTAPTKTKAGVLGLLFGFFLGGLLTLCGYYKEDY